MRVVTADGYAETRDAVSHDWYPLLDDLGLRALLVPNIGSEVDGYLSGCSVRGVILTSGNNVCPETYGEQDITVADTAPARDKTEAALIELARKHAWPLLGVCRGMQMMNAHFGGRILPDLAQRIGDKEQHAASEHRVRIVLPEWSAKFGYERMTVNSYHDQGFTAAELSPKFAAFAVSEKAGVIEGFAHKALPFVGIMWHPERPNPAHDFDQALLHSLFVEQSITAETHRG